MRQPSLNPGTLGTQAPIHLSSSTSVGTRSEQSEKLAAQALEGHNRENGEQLMVADLCVQQLLSLISSGGHNGRPQPPPPTMAFPTGYYGFYCLLHGVVLAVGPCAWEVFSVVAS